MADHHGEKWVELYQKALTELEHAKMRGRIGDAREQILNRVETLKKHPWSSLRRTPSDKCCP